MPNMPPHVKKTKEVNQAIDDNANVIEMDGEADEDRPIEPDFCFEADPDESFYGDDDVDGEGVQTADRLSTESSTCTDESVACDSVESGSSRLGEFQELLADTLTSGDLTDAARTPRPAPPSATSTTRRAESSGLPKKRRAAVSTVAGIAPPPSAPQQTPLAAARLQEAEKYPKLPNFSNRLDGQGLTTFRDTVGGLEEDKETMEASFAKAKRIRALGTSMALKTKLASLVAAANNTGESLLEPILLLHEENECKAEERRAEEEKHRRAEVAAQEARYLADKAEAQDAVAKKSSNMRTGPVATVKMRAFERRS
ncbi:hypothetical protein PF004_g14578 [Phytophthora fragariae]|uniref:Uncharacterized protein n=1 Tax=Phytophthora fragariae TaxID=53985 RepID=A0A6G0NNW8_9STRA|nr:hypothetical protein PF004_g14578 [Phytophthora fragariae]